MKDEYIRKHDAIDAFNRIKDTLKNPETAHYDTLMFYEIEDVLEDVEPADVVPVIRCKDCKYNATTHKCLNPDSFFLIPKDDDFCSYGERREG